MGVEIKNGIASNSDLIKIVDKIGFQNLAPIDRIKWTGENEYIGTLKSGSQVINAKQEKAFQRDLKTLGLKRDPTR